MCMCVCVLVALFIQHAKRMRHVVWSSVANPAIQYFPILFHKRGIFGGKILKINCFDFLCKFCLKRFSFEEELSWILSSINIRLQVKYPLLISSFRRVLYVVCFLLGNYPASGVYMPTFRNTLYVPSS